MEVEKRRIIITGVSRGLGLAMMKGFQALGHAVAGCSSSAEPVIDGDYRVDRVNVADDEAVAAWAETLASDWGAVDLLINNAAIMNRPVPLWEISASEFDQLTAININGVANCIRHFLPAMIQQGSGVVVNFSSGWGRSTSASVAPYCASKYAIEGLSQALAQEVPRGLSVVALNPGIIHTDMLETCWGDGAANFPTADQWKDQAIPMLLGLDASDNGQSLSV